MNDQPRIEMRTMLRMLVGVIWIAGVAFNALWTLRHPEFLGHEGLARDASLGIYRWFFGDVVARAPTLWTVLLILGEIAIGTLTMSRGIRAKAALWGGVAWSLWLFPLIWPYTIMMGPFALLTASLLRDDHRLAVTDVVRRLAHLHAHARHEHA
jgi:hypothetical protein